MTIIASDGRLMVSDSFAFSGCLAVPCPMPKISRAPDGSLVGLFGRADLTHEIHEWVRGGMDWSNLPAIPDGGDEDSGPVGGLWLKPDGTLWRISGCDNTLRPYPVSAPFATGYETASTFAQGAMAAGAPVVKAVELAVAVCQYVGGPLHVEYLQRPVDKTQPRYTDFNANPFAQLRTRDCRKCGDVVPHSASGCLRCGGWDVA